MSSVNRLRDSFSDGADFTIEDIRLLVSESISMEDQEAALEASLVLFDRFESSDPQDYVNLIDAAFETERYDISARYLEESLRKFPRDVDILMLAFIESSIHEKHAKMIEYVDEILALTPSEADCKHLISICADLDAYKTCLKIVNRAEEIHPGNVQCKVWAAEIHHKNEDPEGFKIWYKKARRALDLKYYNGTLSLDDVEYFEYLEKTFPQLIPQESPRDFSLN